MRETVPSPLFATQTAPSPIAIPLGARPTPIVALMERVAGSIRTTVSSIALATQTAPSPTATAVGRLPTVSFCVAAVGSTRVTVLLTASVTQAASAPNATAVGSSPVSTAATDLPLDSETRTRPVPLA